MIATMFTYFRDGVAPSTPDVSFSNLEDLKINILYNAPEGVYMVYRMEEKPVHERLPFRFIEGTPVEKIAKAANLIATMPLRRE